jgi:GT2 family glycosyltransferase
MYYEDIDLSFRIRDKGYSLCYYPDSSIYHIGGVSGKTKTKGKEGYLHPIIHFYNIRNRLWILKKYTPGYFLPSVTLFNFFYFMMLLGYFAIRGRFQKFKMAIKALREGFSGSIRYE